MDFLVVGLGNIGSEYASTRHNMGFMILDEWAQASNAIFTVERYGAVAEVSFKGRHFTLLKPSTYMNLSGNAVRYWMQRLELPLENLLVISDDINLPFGTLRMRKRGSSGGHNGLEHITAMLETDTYARIRVGIGNGFSRGGQIDYVLGNLDEEERQQVPQLAERMVAGIKTWAILGPEKAMNQINTQPQTPSEPAKTAES